MGLASCRPVLDPSSEEGSSGQSSEVDSDTDSSTENPPSGDDSSDSDGTSDSEDSGSSEEEETYDVVCNKMNDFIKNKSFFDIFEIKQALVDAGYNVVAKEDATEYFGYDKTTNKVAYFKNNEVVFPTSNVKENFYSFKDKSVGDLDSIYSAMAESNESPWLYTSLKLTADIQLNQTTNNIVINNSQPIEINLNGHKIDGGSMDTAYLNGYNIKCINKDGVVAIVNGAIETFEKSGFDWHYSPACVSLIEGKSLRITNCTLKNKAERGYSFIDNPKADSNPLCMINDCTIESKIVGICIQKGNYIVDHNTVKGTVVINGGKSVVTRNNISAQNIVNDANRLITDEEILEECQNYKLDGYDTFMLTSPDAILIYDRRSINGTYGSPEVLINNANTLTCKATTSEACGYGVRYMDLNFDTTITQSSHDRGKIIVDIETNIFTNLEAGHTSPVGIKGGVEYFEAN